LRLGPGEQATLTRAAFLERLGLTGDILGATLPKADADIAEAERPTPCASSRCWKTRPRRLTVSWAPKSASRSPA